MHVLRGRASNLDDDRRHTRKLVGEVVDTGESALRVWTPHRQVVFGRRDTRSDGYERARVAARDCGYAVREREVGGRAVAYTDGTVGFVLAQSARNGRIGIGTRYDRALDDVQAALDDCGVDTERGEPPRSFCPGNHSLQVVGGTREEIHSDETDPFETSDSGKIVGVAQRIRQDVAVVAGVVVVDDNKRVTDVLERVYSALGVPFDPESVGRMKTSSGTIEPSSVVRAIEARFAAGCRTRTTTVRGI